MVLLVKRQPADLAVVRDEGVVAPPISQHSTRVVVGAMVEP